MPSISSDSRSSRTSSHTLTDVDPTSLRQVKSAPHFKVVASQAYVIPEVLNHHYEGSGTEDDPYVVEFIPHDPRDPMTFGQVKKWTITLLVAFATLAVSFVSSAYSGGIRQIMEEFGSGTEVTTLGIALFVLGFAIGPLLWAPLSELYGRQILFFGTYGAMTAFNAGTAGSQNIWTLVILRFFAGAFGSSPLTNAGGVIADMFPAAQRGLALSVFAAAPFMGPTLGPIVGGFLSESKGWRWNEGLMAIFTGVIWIMGTLTIPETYAPVLLRARAKALTKQTGKKYVSKLEKSRAKPSIKQEFKVALSRPWLLLFKEPIVALLSVYMAIVYGTLYMMFGAFPVVFQEERGWSEGIGGLAFIGIAIGMIGAVIYNIWDNKRYMRVEAACRARGERGAPPEARLPPSMIGSICLPVGLFIFAWTNYPSIHWIVCIIFTAPFGFGMVLLFLAVFNYLIDSYTIYAASVLAANSVLRSTFGAVFPLFTTYMYANLGIHWASSVPAFLALACVPFPFFFYKYGKSIRLKCKYAAAADEAMAKLQKAREKEENDNGQNGDEDGISASSPELEKKTISRGNSDEVVQMNDIEKAERGLRAEGDHEVDPEGILSTSTSQDPEKDRIRDETDTSVKKSLSRMRSEKGPEAEPNPTSIPVPPIPDDDFTLRTTTSKAISDHTPEDVELKQNASHGFMPA